MKFRFIAALFTAVSCGAFAQSATPSYQPTHQATQTIWRCGADAKSYGNQACADGRAVQVVDVRSAAQVQDAREVVQRDKALVRDMAAQRKEAAREAAVKGTGLIALNSTVKPTAKPTAKTEVKPQKRQAKKKPRATEAADTWTSTAPASQRKRG